MKSLIDPRGRSRLPELPCNPAFAYINKWNKARRGTDVLWMTVPVPNFAPGFWPGVFFVCDRG